MRTRNGDNRIGLLGAVVAATVRGDLSGNLDEEMERLLDELAESLLHHEPTAGCVEFHRWIAAAGRGDESGPLSVALARHVLECDLCCVRLLDIADAVGLGPIPEQLEFLAICMRPLVEEGRGRIDEVIAATPLFEEQEEPLAAAAALVPKRVPAEDAVWVQINETSGTGTWRRWLRVMGGGLRQIQAALGTTMEFPPQLVMGSRETGDSAGSLALFVVFDDERGAAAVRGLLAAWPPDLDLEILAPSLEEADEADEGASKSADGLDALMSSVMATSRQLDAMGGDKAWFDEIRAMGPPACVLLLRRGLDSTQALAVPFLPVPPGDDPVDGSILARDLENLAEWLAAPAGECLDEPLECRLWGESFSVRFTGRFADLLQIRR